MSSLVHPNKERSMIPLFLTIFIDLLGLGIAIPVLAVVFLDPNVAILPADAPLWLRTFGYGMLIAAYPFAQFFGAPILGGLSDRYGRKPTLILSLFGTAFGYVLFALGIYIGNLPLLFASRLLDGFTGGNLSIAFSAIADISPNAKAKTRNFGMVGMAFGLGFILGPFIGGKLADSTLVPWFGFSTPFWFAAVLTMINALLFLWIFDETLHTRSKASINPLTGFRNFGKAFTLPHLRAMFTVIFLLTLGFNFFTQFFQVFLIEKFGFNHGDIGNFFAYVGIWIAITQGGLNRIVAHYFQPTSIFWTTILFLGLSFPLLLIPDQSWGLYALVPLLAIFHGLSQPASTTIVSDLAGKESQGEIMGINQSIMSVAMTIPPIVAGIIASVHINLPILSACIFTLLGWAVYAISFKKKPINEVFHEV